MLRGQTILLATAILAAPAASGLSEDAGTELFEKRIRPILIRHCYECHSAAAAELRGELRLDSRDFLRRGGESGPAVVPGNTRKSLILDALRHDSLEMPPDKKLPDTVVRDFTRWIELGAPDPRDHPPSAEQVAELSWKSIFAERRRWWSFQPVVAQLPPHDIPHPIDAFVAAKQASAGAQPSALANSRTLARRVSLVLTGLPPTTAQVERYVAAAETDADKAYRTYVDELLASPHFGEHWARHWMDVVRFAETHGYEWNHEIRDAWRYRDYLTRAFNSDVPYDQLIREHIAGDLLEQPRINPQLGINESIIGTAFWRFGELGHDNCVDFPEIRFDALDNQIDTFAKAFQGLTIACARCHDHKIDAISTKDYYALVGILENCSQVVHTVDSPLRIAKTTSTTNKIKEEIRQELGEIWLRAIEHSRPELVAAISGNTTLGKDSSSLQRYVANKQLDPADPGYIQGRLNRRDASVKSGVMVSTDDLRQANWLWYPEGNATINAPIESRYYRRRLVLPKDRRVARAWCLFAGDDTVTFFVNGKVVGTGNSHPNLVGVDLTGKLHTGANELAVVNTNGNPQIQPNPGGWLGVLRVEFEDGDPLVIYSDSNWKCVRTAGGNWQIGDFSGEAWVTAMELGKAGIGPWGFPWPKQATARSQARLTEVWQRLQEEYAVESERRVRFNSETFQVWLDFGASDSKLWSATGLGLAQGVSRSGEFRLAHEGEQIVEAILPTGLHTDVISSRLNGSLRTAWVPKNKKYISLQLSGDGRSMVRPVVDSCGLNEFAGGGLRYLANGKSHWKQFPTSAGGTHRSFIELTTKSDNPRWPDRPGRAGTRNIDELASPRSSFSVMRAVLHDSPAAPLTELTPLLPLFKTTQTGDANDVATAYQAVARQVVAAWQADSATDGDVRWINWLLKTGLLPNSTETAPQLKRLVAQYRSTEASIPSPRVVAGLADQGTGRGFPVLQGGDPNKRSTVVPPRYIEVISTNSTVTQGGSGRQELAQVIANPKNPLTARVMVNRIWHHLFGRGIVATPDDFGGMGTRPTHPQLLDYLATQFVNENWSLKRLIRSIVLTETFRRSSLPTEQAIQVDPGNQLLHHYPARRLGAEAIRDTILAISGRLNRKLYGPSVHPFRKKEIDYRKLWSGPLDGNGRRSLYIKVTRMEGPLFLELFDFPNPMAARGRRDQTNVPAQALALLNDPFVIEQARFWAERLVAMQHRSVEERVRHMFQSALGRPATTTEQQRFASMIRSLAGNQDANSATLMKDTEVWQDATHAMLNLKEIIYVK